MKSRFRRFLPRSASVLLSLAALCACTVSEVNPEMNLQTDALGNSEEISPSDSQTGSGETIPEMALRLPPLRLANRGMTDIDALAADKEGATVVVSGSVVQRSALLDGWLYQIREDSGSIWVLTDETAPLVEDTVIVEGVVRHEPIVVGEVDASGVYLEEKSSREVNE